MSTGLGDVSGVSAPGPAMRSHVLSRLEAERRQAVGCFEWERAAEIRAQMDRLSQGSAASPRRETAGRTKRRARA